MPEYLFVYGTLRPKMAPRRLAPLIKEMRSMGKATTPGQLYDLDGYPGAVLYPECDTTIKGEVFELPDDREALAALDAYEGFDPRYPASSLFVRRRRKVTLEDDTKLDCWIYVYNWPVSPEKLIRSGDYLWHQKTKNPRKNTRRSSKKNVRGGGSED